MNGQSRIGRFKARRRATLSIALALLATLAGSCWFGQDAEASRIRSRGISARSSSLGSRPAWNRFLSGGPSLWAQTPSPAIPSGARLPLVNGGLLQTPFVEYLLWRRDLNPTRFDAYHPRVAGIFSQLVTLPAVQALETADPVVSAPVTLTPAAVPAAQEIVPEPGTLAITATVFGTLALWRRRESVKAR